MARPPKRWLFGSVATFAVMVMLISFLRKDTKITNFEFDPARIPPLEACDYGDVSEHGGWCLVLHPDDLFLAPGRPLAKHHVVADDGIALTISEIVGVNDTVLDVGAGIGQYQAWFLNNGIRLAGYLGFDGAPNVEAFTMGTVRFLNAAAPVAWMPHEIADWVVSLEVGEHIAAQSESVFLNNLHRGNRKGIILSWAVPGQLGHSHVNNRPNNYIIAAMEALGYVYDEQLSLLGRRRAMYEWFTNTFMVFRRAH